MKKTCTFCGHSELYGKTSEIIDKLSVVVDNLIKEGFNSFFVGHYGAFDRIAASVCLNAKTKHNEIAVNLVLPYYKAKISREEKEEYSSFDSVIVPSIENTPYKYRIIKANRYMVDRSDVVVAYVTSTIGGAAKTLDYSYKKKKRIILVNKI